MKQDLLHKPKYFVAFACNISDKNAATLLRSMPWSLLNSLTKYWSKWLSKSSPPRKVLPLVDFTLNTPFWISRTEISKVPPPKSKTAITCKKKQHGKNVYRGKNILIPRYIQLRINVIIQ